MDCVITELICAFCHEKQNKTLQPSFFASHLNNILIRLKTESGCVGFVMCSWHHFYFTAWLSCIFFRISLESRTLSWNSTNRQKLDGSWLTGRRYGHPRSVTYLYLLTSKVWFCICRWTSHFNKFCPHVQKLHTLNFFWEEFFFFFLILLSSVVPLLRPAGGQIQP